MAELVYASSDGELFRSATPQLRWLVVAGMGKTLQQQWIITETDNTGHITRSYREWRDVPSESWLRYPIGPRHPGGAGV